MFKIWAYLSQASISYRFQEPPAKRILAMTDGPA